MSRGEEVPASLSRRTTLATVEEMVLRSVHSMLSENEKNLEVSGKLNPMVFLGKPEFGDYQCNIALSLSKQLQMKPRDVAQKLMVSMMLQKDNDVVEKMDISGPGFINIHISSQYLQRKLQDMVGDSTSAVVVTNEKKNEVNRLGIPKVSKPQKIVVDFSSPNIAKEMHVVSIAKKHY